MNLFNDHIKLYSTAGLLFIFLTCIVVILPALSNQKNNAPLPGSAPMTSDAKAGKLIYIAEGCVGCHSQQVRNVEMDKVFGSRPGMASDYANIGRTSIWQNTATLMGTERTGPDLTDVGNRQPSRDWNLMHLYNPRIVVKESIMPSYKWLFEEKYKPDSDDVIVNIPAEFKRNKETKIIAKKEALNLLAYILSLRQAQLPQNIATLPFLYKNEKANSSIKSQNVEKSLDGKALYITHCQSCHQSNGEGLKGAFPPLKGSKIVNGDNLELYVDIIMNGYDAASEYGVMAGVGTNMNFTEKEITAIINFERTSWGNNGKLLTEAEVKKVLDFIKIKTLDQ